MSALPNIHIWFASLQSVVRSYPSCRSFLLFFTGYWVHFQKRFLRIGQLIRTLFIKGSEALFLWLFSRSRSPLTCLQSKSVIFLWLNARISSSVSRSLPELGSAHAHRKAGHYIYRSEVLWCHSSLPCFRSGYSSPYTGYRTPVRFSDLRKILL